MLTTSLLMLVSALLILAAVPRRLSTSDSLLGNEPSNEALSKRQPASLLIEDQIDRSLPRTAKLERRTLPPGVHAYHRDLEEANIDVQVPPDEGLERDKERWKNLFYHPSEQDHRPHVQEPFRSAPHLTRLHSSPRVAQPGFSSHPHLRHRKPPLRDSRRPSHTKDDGEPSSPQRRGTPEYVPLNRGFLIYATLS